MGLPPDSHLARAAQFRLAALTPGEPGSPAVEVAEISGGRRKTLSVEHPSGEMSCVLALDESGQVASAALLRTAYLLTGDARATDPVCHLSPHHDRVAGFAAVQDDVPYAYRHQ